MNRLVLSGLICLMGGSLSQPTAFAGELDSASAEALRKTKELLVNKSLRDKAIQENPNGKQVDAEVSNLAGSAENKELIYEISSEVFSEIAKKSEGDPIKMQELLNKAKANPKEFFENLSKKSQNSIQEAAKRIPASGK